ncbi:hypothetical protein, conserved [Eimeria necatrix]|uniref:Uncharacterized protein n=1 Tax=Eimeria necatrix TaxID=51315 RepID=U6MVY7_9EIME|nr:hypothetical protein, conserved [Eimeria necatrix]CDJ68116.1 hypothetical protein, conserved [Eimeria necatrix]
MQVELSVLELLRSKAIRVLPVGADGTLVPCWQPAAALAAEQAATSEAQERLLLLPLLRRVPGASLEYPIPRRQPGEPPVYLSVQLDSCADTTATDLWGPACGLLLCYLLQHQEALQLQQRQVLELGCGLGAPSSLCCLLGAPWVLPTDCDSAALSLTRCNLSLSAALHSFIFPIPASASASGGAAEALAAAAVRLLERIRSKKQQQQQQNQEQHEGVFSVSDILCELGDSPRATAGPLKWSEDASEVRQQLLQLQQQRQHRQDRTAEIRPCVNLVVASDVLYSDKAAAALACTIHTVAGVAAECRWSHCHGKVPAHREAGDRRVSHSGKSAVGSVPGFLCLISHQVRHAVYAHQGQLAREGADSALQSFISNFETLQTDAKGLAATYARKPLRKEQPGSEQAAAAANAPAEAEKSDSPVQLYVRIIEEHEQELPRGAWEPPEGNFKDRGGVEMTQKGDSCLPEGSVCLLAIASDPEQLLQLPPAAGSATKSLCSITKLQRTS